MPSPSPKRGSRAASPASLRRERPAIRDPDTVQDRLPQPFGLVHDLINELVAAALERSAREREAPSIERYQRAIPVFDLATAPVIANAGPAAVTSLSSAYCVTTPGASFAVVADALGVVRFRGRIPPGLADGDVEATPSTEVRIEAFRTLAAAELASLPLSAPVLGDAGGADSEKPPAAPVLPQTGPVQPPAAGGGGGGAGGAAAVAWQDLIWCASGSLLLPPHTPPPAPDMVQRAIPEPAGALPAAASLAAATPAPAQSSRAPAAAGAGGRGRVAFAGGDADDGVPSAAAAQALAAQQQAALLLPPPAVWAADGPSRGFLLAVAGHAVAAVAPPRLPPPQAAPAGREPRNSGGVGPAAGAASAAQQSPVGHRGGGSKAAGGGGGGGRGMSPAAGSRAAGGARGAAAESKQQAAAGAAAAAQLTNRSVDAAGSTGGGSDDAAVLAAAAGVADVSARSGVSSVGGSVMGGEADVPLPVAKHGLVPSTTAAAGARRGSAVAQPPGHAGGGPHAAAAPLHAGGGPPPGTPAFVAKHVGGGDALRSGAGACSLGRTGGAGVVRIFHVPADALAHGAEYACTGRRAAEGADRSSLPSPIPTPSAALRSAPGRVDGSQARACQPRPREPRLARVALL